MAKYYLTGEMKKIGFEIYEGEFGTLFGHREGTMKGAPVIMLGPHYDSVVNGGVFDSVAGSASALEVICVLTEEGFMNDYPLELILMNAEEGAAFGSSTDVSNSRAMPGTMIQRELETVKNRFGQTKLEVMAEYGLKPDLRVAIHEPGFIKSFLKLYIEQGPVLEHENTEIGLIRYLAGVGRYTICSHGVAADSTVPMDSRKDTLVAAASFIAGFDRQIKALGLDITGMVDKPDVTPNPNQFVPEYVEGKIETRTFSRECIERTNFEKLTTAILNAVSAEYGTRTELEGTTRINYPNPTGSSAMCAENVARMKTICEGLGYNHMIINNGTGHDSMIMTDFCDTNMIYASSNRGGVSHCLEEQTEYVNIKKGADVLLYPVTDLSKNKRD